MDEVYLPDWVDTKPRLDALLHGLIFEWPCHVLGAHYAIGDQCGIPAHDYCAWCQKGMPNQAERTGGSHG